MASEEAKSPATSVPRSIAIALAVVATVYVASTTSLTLMIPYDLVDVEAPFPSAFAVNGMTWARYVIAVGALVGLSTSLMGSMFTLPRAAYAMAADGLFFRAFADVSSKTQVPVLAVVVFGLLSALLALVEDLTTLVEFMSIGTLCSFSMVAASVLVLRYQPDPTSCEDSTIASGSATPEPEMNNERRSVLPSEGGEREVGRLKLGFREWPLLWRFEGKPIVWIVSMMATAFTAFNALALQVTPCKTRLSSAKSWRVVFFFQGTAHLGEWWAIILLSIFFLLSLFSYFILVALQHNKVASTFQVRITPHTLPLNSHLHGDPLRVFFRCHSSRSSPPSACSVTSPS